MFEVFTLDGGLPSGPWDELQEDLVSPSEPYATVPVSIASDMTATCQEAVRWFHESSHVFLGDPAVRRILDGEVRERISGYQEELDREWRRVTSIPESALSEKITGPNVLKYTLSKMPFARQRALVERWERTWTDWLEAHPGWTVTDKGFLPPMTPSEG